MEFGTLFYNLGDIKKFLDPPTHTLVNISWNLALCFTIWVGGIKVYRPPTHTNKFLGVGYKKVFRPPQKFTNQTKSGFSLQPFI